MQLIKDNVENKLPQFLQVKCGYHTTFAIDEKGQVWSWGGGNLGYKNDHSVYRPRRIIENTENRRFVDLTVIANAAAVFARKPPAHPHPQPRALAFNLLPPPPSSPCAVRAA